MDADTVAQIEEIIPDGELAQKVFDISLTSMGQDLSEIDTK